MYLIDRKTYVEDPNHKLGGGSEGAVYTFPDDPSLCVKLFHEPDIKDRESLDLAAYRAKKVSAICKLKPTLKLPDHFILPTKPALNNRGDTVGYLMKKVPAGFVKVMELLKLQFRIDHDFHLQKICLLFADIFDDALLVHKNGLVFGDINTGCVLINPLLKKSFVDCDSWSYPNFPCLATTELFCHPDLYVNLMKGGKLVPPEPHHDRFAFLVMFLLMALHGAHPFRMGTHKKYNSLRERCQRGVTILDQDVDYPPMLPPREILSDDLLHELVVRLKRKVDKPLDSNDLRKFSSELFSCPNCGTQYHRSRTACPKCHERTLVEVAKKVVEMLFKTDGEVLFTQVIGSALRVACRVKDKLQIVIIDDQKKVVTMATGLPVDKGARYRFFDSYLVVCKDPYAEAPVLLEIYKIEGSKVTLAEKTTTGALENASAVFETSSKYLYRTAGNTLMCARFFNRILLEQPVAEVHRNQTWFMVDRMSGADREVVFGYDRALKEYQWFIIAGNSEGEDFRYHTVDLPLRSREKLEDFIVYFNSTSALLVRKTRYRGSECVRYSTINLDGNVVQDLLFNEGDVGFDMWREIQGKLLQSSSILHLSAQGIIKHEFSDNSYTPVKDTDVVMLDDRLLRFGKMLAVVRRNAIVVITSQKK